MESKNLLHWDQAVLRLKYYLDSSKRLQALILSTVNGSKPGFLCSSLQTSFITSADTSLISLCLNASKPPFWQESESYRQYLMWSIYTTAGRFDSAQLYLIRITSQTCFFCFIYICFLLEVVWASYLIQGFWLIYFVFFWSAVIPFLIWSNYSLSFCISDFMIETAFLLSWIIFSAIWFD